jgi:peptidoglycan/LPS O-acetylase OafA/YrhL
MLHKLESLRGVAACMVVLYHSPFNYGDGDVSFISNSYLFVDFFFVLSGFVMSLAYSSQIRGG